MISEEVICIYENIWVSPIVFNFITILSSSFFVFILCQKMPKVIVYSIVIIRWTKLYDSSSATH